ncbi:hypothetical protein LPB140_06020 [Sphingorhabdus lutea]|uniref:GGDEF domain-containing protein n=1 Tax=Sphingorhabdus lutea TaxID=1913578 RepID=A0A1L3JBA8_9SPHN|nr:diguanylate cyclase [Sphingorhabdus lutea]APG62424.1 hypothetical protein LPB140_06020 [Sphingorhabdus lutea]
MRAKLFTIYNNLFPAVPVEIVDDFDMLCTRRLHRQCSWLFLALFFNTPMAVYITQKELNIGVTTILPIIIITSFLFGFLSLRRIKNDKMSLKVARRFTKDAIIYAPIITLLVSIWCISNWFIVKDSTRIYYSMIMSMGTLAAVYCISSVRLGAILTLSIGMLPMTFLMMFSGDMMDLATSFSFIMATIFMYMLIYNQHNQLVELLVTKQKVQLQANTDPLTGLLNRRALDEKIEQQFKLSAKKQQKDNIFTLALIDLDGFKPVNDIYGHAVGDQLLLHIALRLTDILGDNVIVARQGGDEFAILVPHHAKINRYSIADIVFTALAAPFNIDEQMIRVGGSVGVAHWPRDGRDRKSLFETADKALYLAKAQNKISLLKPSAHIKAAR